MTPPKLGFLMPNKVFSGQKKFLVAPKLKKIDFLKKLPVNISGTIDFQNNPSREPKIHWQILVNIFHNLNGLQERCAGIQLPTIDVFTVKTKWKFYLCS